MADDGLPIKLRSIAHAMDTTGVTRHNELGSFVSDAADEIERQRADIAKTVNELLSIRDDRDRLRAALERAEIKLRRVGLTSEADHARAALSPPAEIRAPDAGVRAEVSASVEAKRKWRTCRDDGRCQYAVETLAEGEGACPPGMCQMPRDAVPAEAKPVDDLAARQRELDPDAKRVLYGRRRELYRRDAVPASEPPDYRDFWRKYALPPLGRPSCLVCGRDDYAWPPAIQHAELPGIVVCHPCRDARATVQPAERPLRERCRIDEKLRDARAGVQPGGAQS